MDPEGGRGRPPRGQRGRGGRRRHDRSRNRNQRMRSGISRSPCSEEPRIITPTKILSNSSRSAVSPDVQPMQILRKKSAESRPGDQESSSQTRPSPHPSSVSEIPSQAPARPAPLLDKYLQFRSDAAARLLRAQPDFTVVGVIGAQGAGKSTVLSRFATSETKHSRRCFSIQNASIISNCSHMTSGVDMYATQQRVILLDTQPVMSPSILAGMIQRHDQLGAGISSYQNSVDIQSLELTLFLLSVCHVVIIVSDLKSDLRTWQMLRTAMLLRETSELSDPLLASGSQDSRHPTIPDIVFAFNKLPEDQMTSSSFLRQSKVLQKIFHTSPFRKQGAIANSQFRSAISDEGDTVNCFFIPKIGSKRVTREHRSTVKDAFEASCSEFATQVLSMPKLRSAKRISELEWLKNAARIWSDINNCRSLMEYNKTLQKLGIYK
eukprot:139969_1